MDIKTVALIKSDAIRRQQDPQIILRIQEEGFVICKQISLHLSEIGACALYLEHQGKPYFDALIKSVLGEWGVIALLLQKENCIDQWRKLMGPSDPRQARDFYPKSLRALFGTLMPDNAVHGSSSYTDYIKESNLLFGNKTWY